MDESGKELQLSDLHGTCTTHINLIPVTPQRLVMLLDFAMLFICMGTR